MMAACQDKGKGQTNRRAKPTGA